MAKPWEKYGQEEGSGRFYEPGPWSKYDPVVDDQMMRMGFPQENPETIPEAYSVTRREALESSGLPIDNESQFGIMERADYESSRHNPNEVRSKFMSRYPNGEFRTIEVDGNPVFLTKPDAAQQNYTLINPVGLDMSDFGAVLAQAPEVAGGIAGALLSGGRGWFGKILYDFVGGGLGAGSKEALDEMRGVQQDTPEEVAQRVILEGAINAGAGLAARSVTGVRNATRSGSIIDDAGREIQAAGSRLGVRVPPQYLTDNRAIHRFAAQSKAASNLLSKAESVVQESALNQARGLVGDGGVAAGRELRDNVIPRQMDAAAASETSTLPNVENYDFWFGGREITEGTKRYIKSTKNVSRQLYDDALKEAPDGIMLDVSNPVAIAKDISAGVKGLVKAEDGTVAEKTILTVNGELQRIANAVKGLDGTQSFDTVRQLRSELWQLKQASKVSGMTAHEKAANDLFMALDDAFENPVGAYSQKFMAKFRRANTFYRGMKQRIDNTVLSKIAEAENPADLARYYASPGNYENLRVLRKSLDDKSWTALRNTFHRDLLWDAQNNGWHNSNTINEVLDNWKKTDPRGLRMLLSESEEVSYRKVGNALNKLASSDAVQILNRQYEAGKIAYDAVVNRGPDEIERMLSVLGPDGKRLLKDSLADYLFTSSLYRDTARGGKVVLNPAVLGEKIRAFDDMRVRGALEKLFSPDELQKITDIERITSVFQKASSDPGASLEVARDFASLKNVTRGDIFGTLKGAHGIMMNRMIGKVMLHPAMNRILFGSAKPKLGGTNLRVLATVLANEAEAINTLSEDAVTSYDKLIDQYGNTQPTSIWSGQ